MKKNFKSRDFNLGDFPDYNYLCCPVLLHCDMTTYRLQQKAKKELQHPDSESHPRPKL